MPTAAGRLLFSQHAALTKFSFFVLFFNFEESMGEVDFFTLEQMLLSKHQREEGIEKQKGRELERTQMKWRQLRVHYGM